MASLPQILTANRLRDGDVVYPAPWARDVSTSFLLSEGYTRKALEGAGFKVVLWRDDTQIALDWFKTAMTGPPPSGPNLGIVMGPDFPKIAISASLAPKGIEHASPSNHSFLAKRASSPALLIVALGIDGHRRRWKAGCG